MRDKSVQFCEAAFPLKDAVSNDQLGMTLRDYFAAHAMQGLLCGPSLSQSHKEYAAMCYKIADAMLKARDGQ